jgi:hypothetical protein
MTAHFTWNFPSQILRYDQVLCCAALVLILASVNGSHEPIADSKAPGVGTGLDHCTDKVAANDGSGRTEVVQVKNVCRVLPSAWMHQLLTAANVSTLINTSLAAGEGLGTVFSTGVLAYFVKAACSG